MTPAERAARQRRANGGGLLDFGNDLVDAGVSMWEGMNNLQRLSLAPIPIVSDIAGLAGDVQSMYENPKERTLANAGWSALGVLPFVPAGLGTIGGRGAKTLNPEALKMAESMKEAGKSRDEIWKATGEQFGQPAYFDPVDGSFRFEIDDSDSFLEAPKHAPTGNEKLVNEAVSDAYPDYKNIQQSIRKGEYGGSYDAAHDTITARGQSGPERRSVATHEINHALQQREGFARGGSPAMFEDSFNREKFNLDYFKGELVDQYATLKDSPKYQAVQAKIEKRLAANDLGGDFKDLLAQREELVPYRMRDTQSEIWRLEDATRLNPDQQYRRLLGEVDSRATQDRMDMTMQERVDNPIWGSYDVPEDEITRRYRGSGNERMLDASVSRNGDPIPDEGLLGDYKRTDRPTDIFESETRISSPDGTGNIDIAESQWSPTKYGITNFLVDEVSRGKGIGGGLLDEAIADYGDELSGAFSSKESLKAAYNRGFRGLGSRKDMDLEQLEKVRRDDSSVSLSYQSKSGDPIPNEGLLGIAKAPQDDALITAQKNAALPVEDGGLGLPANNSPLERAEAMGFDTDTDWYHGSTHDIHSFGGGTANPEGYLGGGHYFTDSALDASENYAGMGPDLTGRVQQRAEQIANNVVDERGVSEEVAERYAQFKAKRELVGDNSGVVYPSLLRSEKTLDITPDNQTMLGYDELNPADYMDDAKDAVDIDDFMGDGVLDEDMYKEALDESAADLAREDASYRDPEGELADIRSGLLYSDYNDMDGGQAFDDSLEQFGIYPGDGERVGAGDLFDALKGNESMAYAIDPEGRMASGQALADSVESAGYSGILMDADKAFGNQSGRVGQGVMDMDYGTKHMILQDPSRIRSRMAAFDPFKKDSANILAGVGGLGMTGLLGYGLTQGEDPYAWGGL